MDEVKENSRTSRSKTECPMFHQCRSKQAKAGRCGLKRWCLSVIGKKIYLQPRGTILHAISDLAELQKGKFTFSDTPNGNIHFSVNLYQEKWEFKFLVVDIGKNRSIIELELEGSEKTESIINHEYALLDSILTEGARIEPSVIKTNTGVWFCE